MSELHASIGRPLHRPGAKKSNPTSLGRTQPPDSYIRILGTPVSIVTIDGALRRFEQWVLDPEDRCVVLRDVHGVMLAHSDPRLDRAHQESDLIAPDGIPLVWAARLAGSRGISRVCGPDLLPTVCEHGLTRGWRHYFYGGAPGVAEMVADQLAARFPGLKIVGTQSPPFRPLTPEEDEAACAAIRAASPDFVWVGLGTPKQEIWTVEHRGKCGGAILLSVGAAFDFHAGLVSRAPLWMQRYGLEWSYRLAQEPKRLWKRYLILAPRFAVLSLLEIIKVRISRRFAHAT
jgi:N-acetylglucosaminyldiphosphoundecaprenol N-acetyl-beta-D-mannosaminyltransferase